MSTSEQGIEEAARDFSVSRYVIARRLLNADAISMAHYKALVEKWQKERRPKPKKKTKGGPSPSVTAVSELGSTFVSRVVDAHASGLITDADVADYLSLRLKHLDRAASLATRGE
jgi:Zn-dependent peptidase ImmA (M78 family)